MRRFPPRLASPRPLLNSTRLASTVNLKFCLASPRFGPGRSEARRLVEDSLRFGLCLILQWKHISPQLPMAPQSYYSRWEGVLYVNHTRKRQWLGAGQIGVPTPKNDLHPKKIMLSVWWGVGGMIHWELLRTGCTITADLYCQQFDRVATKFQGKQDRIYFLHDNIRPHIAKSTREKLVKLGWITVTHPPYSPDLAPTD